MGIFIYYGCIKYPYIFICVCIYCHNRVCFSFMSINYLSGGQQGDSGTQGPSTYWLLQILHWPLWVWPGDEGREITSRESQGQVQRPRAMLHTFNWPEVGTWPQVICTYYQTVNLLRLLMYNVTARHFKIHLFTITWAFFPLEKKFRKFHNILFNNVLVHHLIYTPGRWSSVPSMLGSEASKRHFFLVLNVEPGPALAVGHQKACLLNITLSVCWFVNRIQHCEVRFFFSRILWHVVFFKAFIQKKPS